MATNFSKNGIIQGVIDFFCLVCETTILNTAECEAHMNTAEHEKNFSNTTYYKDFKEDCIRKIKNKYFCELCNTSLPVLPRVRLHVKDQKHIDNKNIGWLKRVDGAIIAFNELVIDDKAWHGFSDESCIICNTECDDNEIHKKLPSHILNLYQMKVDFDEDKNIYRKIDEYSFHCLTCNVIQNVTDVTNHFDSPTHQDLLQISYNTYDLSKVCTKLNCEPKDDVNKLVEQTDVCLYSNNQEHVENPTVTKENISEKIELKPNEEEAAAEKTTKNVFKYTFGDTCGKEVKSCTKSNGESKNIANKSYEQTDVCLPSKNQVDVENNAETQHNNSETIILESNEENIETNNKDSSKSTYKSVELTDVCLASNNQIDIENPAETKQNIIETSNIEPNEENVETNSIDSSKSICESKESVDKYDEQTDVYLDSNNQADKENSTETEQNIPEAIELEANAENIESSSKDCLKSICELKDEKEQNIPETIELEPNEENVETNSADSSKSTCDPIGGIIKTVELTDVCLPLNNQEDIENPAETRQNITETGSIEPNEENVETNSADSSKSTCDPIGGIIKTVELTDVCLPLNNQEDIENPAETKQNITETGNIEPNEENVETNSTDSSKSNCESKDSVDKSDKQTDVYLDSNNQADKENSTETEQNIHEAIELEANGENIETNSKHCSTSNNEPEDGFNNFDIQTDVCLPSNNQADVENPAETKQNITETGNIEQNKENVETNSADSSKSTCDPIGGIIKSVEVTDVCLPSNNQVDIENPAETRQNITETGSIEPNEENVETNSADSSKSTCDPIGGIIKTVELTDVCLPLNNQEDIENPAETKQNITETGNIEPNEENVETNSTDSSKSNCESKDSVDKSDKQTDVYLDLNNQVDIENPAETKQNIPETGNVEPNEENVETNSIDNCELKDSVAKSDEQTDTCLHSNNQLNKENSTETEQKIPESFEFELNDENIESNNKGGSKDETEETIKNVRTYILRDIRKKELFEVLKVSDCITLEQNNKSWCIICNWVIDSSAVAEHLNIEHHKRKNLQMEKPKGSSKKCVNTKICIENNNINDSSKKDLNSESNNNIEIYLGIDKAFCKKCSVNLYFENIDVKRHILEHFEKDENIGEGSIIFSTEFVKNDTLFSSPVLPEDNESVQIDNISGNGSQIITMEQADIDKLRQVKAQITEGKLTIQQINELLSKIEKIPTQCFTYSLIIANDYIEGVKFCDIVINKSFALNYGSFSFITVNREYMTCHACGEIFTNFTTDTFQGHHMSTKHDLAMRETPVLTKYLSEFIREIRPGYIHCGFCNAIESMDDLETHLNSVNHKECKGIASWRLHLYQPLFDKTGFQSIYANHGISRGLSMANIK